jgi:hypothetical protein
MEEYPHISRWCRWIDEVTQIDYSKIKQFQQKRQGKMKDAIQKLTASKDLIGAVRCGIHEEVIKILDKEVFDFDDE